MICSRIGKSYSSSIFNFCGTSLLFYIVNAMTVINIYFYCSVQGLSFLHIFTSTYNCLYFVFLLLLLLLRGPHKY
jgi:hypothetical protein